MAEVETPQELDLELVRRVQRGESAAFDVLVRKYQHRKQHEIDQRAQRRDQKAMDEMAQNVYLRQIRVNSHGARP